MGIREVVGEELLRRKNRAVQEVINARGGTPLPIEKIRAAAELELQVARLLDASGDSKASVNYVSAGSIYSYDARDFAAADEAFTRAREIALAAQDKGIVSWIDQERRKQKQR